MLDTTHHILFDLVQVGAGIQIKSRQTDQAQFVLKFEKKGAFKKRIVTTIHRAPVDAKGTLPHHFAQWDDKHLEIIRKSPEGSHDKPGIGKRYKTQEYLQRRRGVGIFGTADTFYVGHKPYQLVQSRESRRLELYTADDLETPLALFRQHSNFSSSIASIRIYPIAIGLDIEDQADCLIWDGKPTKLMERAIIAERLWTARQSWWSRL